MPLCRARLPVPRTRPVPRAPARPRRPAPPMTEAPPQEVTRSRRVVNLAAQIYLPMMISALFARAPGTLRVQDAARLAWGLGAAVLLSAAVVLASRWAGAHTAWGRRLHAEFHALLGGLGSWQVLALALLSAGGEESLFRGALQPRIGLWPASLLFAALHFPLRRTLLPWTAFAFVLGVMMGVLTEWAGSLWPAILLHFLVNFRSLHDLAAPAAPDAPPGEGSA
jgi:CAAX protease family protein